MKFLTACLISVCALGCHRAAGPAGRSEPGGHDRGSSSAAPDPRVEGVFAMTDMGQRNAQRALGMVGTAGPGLLESLINPHSIRLLLHQNGHYQINMVVAQTRGDQPMMIEFIDPPANGSLRAQLTHLGLDIEVHCIAQSSDAFCDPRANALISFRKVDSWTNRPTDQNQVFLYQSAIIHGASRGQVVSDFSTPLMGQLTALTRMMADGGPFISLEAEGVPGKLVFENVKTVPAGSLNWQINRRETTFANAGKFSVAPLTPNSLLPLRSNSLRIDVDNAPWPSRAWLFLSRGIIDLQIDRN